MRRWLITALILVTSGESRAVNFNGAIQNWTAVRTGGENEILLNRNRFRLNSSYSGATGGAWSSVDFTSYGQGTGDEFEVNIRELYLDLYLGNWDLRIGKQQVVWGKTDGIFVNDIVNPFDLRFFLLQDFEDIRIGNSMVKASGYFGLSRLEMIFIPVFKPWKFADPGSPWGPPSSVTMPMNGIDVLVNRDEPTLPSETLRNSEWGLRFSTFLFGADLSLLYLDAFQDRTIMEFQSMEFTQTGAVINMGQVYTRSPMVGVNFARPFGGFLLRGEGALFKDAAFNTRNTSVTDPAPIISESSDFVQGVLGVDLTGPFGTNISFQYLMRKVMTYNSAMIGISETENLVTALISGSFWNENASTKLLTLVDNENNSGMIYGSFSYKFSDMIKAETGYVNIWGNAETASSQFNFGLFEKNDLAYVKLTYSF